MQSEEGRALRRDSRGIAAAPIVTDDWCDLLLVREIEIRAVCGRVADYLGVRRGSNYEQQRKGR